MFFVFGLVLLEISAEIEINSTEISEQNSNCSQILSPDLNITEEISLNQTIQARINLTEAPVFLQISIIIKFRIFAQKLHKVRQSKIWYFYESF